MIIEGIFDVLFALIYGIVDLLPSIPGGNVGNSITSIFNLIFQNLDFLTIFIRPTTFQLIIPLFLGIVAFEEIYHLVMWVIKKIPMLSMS